MVAFGTARMGFTRIVLQAGASPQLAGTAGIMDTATARLEAILISRRPALAAAERPMAARMAITAVMAILALATAEKPMGQAHVESIIAEAHKLLAAYLSGIDARARAGQISHN